MKYFKLLILLFLIQACTPDKVDTTTYYFIRHAEKVRTDKTDRNPDLNINGLQRAKKWSEVFANVPFDAVYSTDYNRTKQTAKPTADSRELPILLYNPRKMYDDAFRANTQGKTVLVVGHSNTTPVFVNTIIGTEKYQQIDDRNNANLYIVTVTKDKVTSVLLKID